jgi:hypothetical protein
MHRRSGPSGGPGATLGSSLQRKLSNGAACANSRQPVVRKWIVSFGSLILIVGKASPLLAFVTRLREDTRRTLMVQHEDAAGR